MTTLILLVVWAGILGSGFHVLAGRGVVGLVIDLLASGGGGVVGLLVAQVLGWQWFQVGTLPLLPTAAGSLIFLLLAFRARASLA